MRRLFLCMLLVSGAAHADELRVVSTRESLTATHIRYQQFIDGIPVVGGERIETVERSGVRRVRESLARRSAASRTISPSSARAGANLADVNLNGEARLAIRSIAGDHPIERYERYHDATTGDLLYSRPLFFRATGRVFDPNPVAKTNDTSLQDRRDSAAAVPETAYSVVDLPGLVPAGELASANVHIVDVDAPSPARADASQPLSFDRSQPQFEEVNAYFHVDRSQRYLQSLGFDGTRRVVGYAIPIDAHAVNGSDNSYYLGDADGQGMLLFGDGGTDDAEDADIVLHEFAHAIHDWIAPSAFNGPASGEGRAMAEGFGDYWAFSSTYAQTIASGRDPFCIGDWDARCAEDATGQSCSYSHGADCLRRVDSVKTLADFIPVDSSGTEHLNGEIWSAALRDVFLGVTARYGVEQGRRIADKIVIESLFGAPSDATFATQGVKLLAADAALNGGANADVICRALTMHGILSIAACTAPPRGERTLFQSSTSLIHVADGRAVDEVFVRVQLDRVDAQPRLTLVGPDGTSIVLSSAPSTDATYGIDAPSQQPLSTFHGRNAAGDWRLVVDGAQLRSWSLSIRFAGDAPLATRPFSGQQRKHIPAVAHVIGAAYTLFLTDVVIYNRTDLPAQLIAIFTPSGADGTTQFAAERLTIEPRRVVVLNDVVGATLQSAGSGHLEILGDVDRIIVTSRTYSPVAGGSFAQTVPALNTTDAGADVIAPLLNTTAYRANVGVAEVGGERGIVRFSFFDAAGNGVATRDMSIEPFGHAQIRVPAAGENMRAVVSVVGGTPRVLAYGSVVDNFSSDAFTIPARRLPAEPATVAIPSLYHPGPNGAPWRTDVYRTSATQVIVAPDVRASSADLFFAYFVENTRDIVAARMFTNANRGTLGQFIPALTAPLTAAPQQLIGVEQSTRFRTTVGLINFSSAVAPATLIAYDASGNELGRLPVTVQGRALQQLPLTAIVAGAVLDGRVEIRADGSIAAYASIINMGTEDPIYIVGQF